ncbi:hypothetical protein QL285_034532 [Trifolium repens]|nr:hypothetical protein QL285_065229 [Trifolium repens]KAK2424141.1 hypothetical protein QL285_034532 [Trifolium repens]
METHKSFCILSSRLLKLFFMIIIKSTLRRMLLGDPTIDLNENYRLLDMREEYQYGMALDLYETRLPKEGPRI